MVFVVVIAGMVIVTETRSLYLGYRDHFRTVTFTDRSGNRADFQSFFYMREYKAVDEGLDWVKANATPDQIMATSMPGWAYVRTGLKSVMAPMEADQTTEQRYLDSVPVKYALVDTGTGVDYSTPYLLPLMLHAPQHWKKVYTDSRGLLSVYERQ